MRLFLDTSVLLAAAASATGASCEIFRLAPSNGWILVTTPYVVAEVLRNLPEFSFEATSRWVRLRSHLRIMDDVLTVDKPVVFEASKDRPILFSALAWCDVLLTLDRKDFGTLLDSQIYGLRVLKPGTFIASERATGRLA